MQVIKKYEDTVLQILNRTWKKLSEFDRDKLDKLFADPVDPEANPDYPKVIARPMDLSTIEYVPSAHLVPSLLMASFSPQIPWHAVRHGPFCNSALQYTASPALPL